LHHRVQFTVDDKIGKAMQKDAPRSVEMQRPAARCVGDSVDREIELVRKSLAETVLDVAVPGTSFCGLKDGVRMNIDA